MSHGYKTILSQFDSTAQAVRRLDAAATLARDFDAHLAVVYTVATRIYGDPFIIDGSALIAQDLVRLRDQKEADAKAAFDKAVGRLDRPVEWRSDDGDPARVVCEQGRYADLIVLGQYERDAASDTDPDFIGRVVLGSGRPVLVIPYAGHFPVIGRRVLVAWNASRESARAVDASLPLLRRASDVQIVSFNARPGRGGHGEVPGADIGLFLARHGVKATVSTSGSHDVDVGNLILSRAADFGSDLIVMGGYGHTRAYEFVLGGATQTLLESMTVPVLYAH